jgi:hypothetical protein
MSGRIPVDQPHVDHLVGLRWNGDRASNCTAFCHCASQVGSPAIIHHNFTGLAPHHRRNADCQLPGVGRSLPRRLECSSTMCRPTRDSRPIARDRRQLDTLTDNREPRRPAPVIRYNVRQMFDPRVRADFCLASFSGLESGITIPENRFAARHILEFQRQALRLEFHNREGQANRA